LAWPVLAARKHLLLSSPTGSGKTLAAFLPIIDRLLAEPFASGTRCLYVTPLKALGNDIRKNLRAHLRDIGGQGVRVGLRTGDTSPRTRRHLREQPPDILLTTPESLAVLLSQRAAIDLFAGLRWVVVDELHALAGNKRGADLALSLERLEWLACGGLQRIGLSATCAPLSEAARFLVGTDRPCTIAQVAETTPLHLTIEPLEDTGRFLATLVDRLAPVLTEHQTTLIFTNTRSLAERLTWALGRQFPDWLGDVREIGVHHSSLAAARRRVVERQLKQGRLRCVVSSTSLELGIDIGQVEAVVLVHPPGDVVRLLQRVGRAGHGPDRPRRGLVLTANPAELLEAAVTGASGHELQCEPLHIPSHPLDVLCQQLLGMAAQGPWTADEADALVRRAHPFRDLPRDDFNDCLDYLSGRRKDGQSWLPARLRWQGDQFVIQDDRTARLLRRNLGTIIAGEPRLVLLQRESSGEDSRPKTFGEVEETFADRLNPGDRFLLGGRCLEVRHSDGNGVLVEEVMGRPVVPRWGGEGWPLSAELAGRLYLLRIRAAEALRDGPAALAAVLAQDYGLVGRAAQVLSDYFQRQECLSEIPDRATCLVEVVGTDGGTDYYFHTPLNRLANDALARVAVRRLVRNWGQAVTSIVADLGFLLSVRGLGELTPEMLRSVLAVPHFDEDLAAAVADSVTLRERFRRVALTGLMLLRNPLGQRRRVGGPDWAERRLFARVSTADPDFVLLRQARREVLADCCDAVAARAFLENLSRWTIRVRRLAQVSPFAESWTQTAAGPAETVETPAEALHRLHAALTMVEDVELETPF
jgi:ATP-dependent Lhr-like helicase